MTAHRVTWFAPDRPVDGTTIYARPDPHAAALIARLLCRRCGHSIAARHCTCQPGSIAELDALAARVRDRHTAAVELARSSTELARLVAAQRAAW